MRHLFPKAISYNYNRFVDSTPLRVCKNQRVHIHKTFKGIVQKGKYFMGWLFGFKQHLICNERGELLNFIVCIQFMVKIVIVGVTTVYLNIVIKFLISTGELGKGQRYDLDSDHQFIATEKYDAKPTYKKFTRYSPGIVVIGDHIAGIKTPACYLLNCLFIDETLFIFIVTRTCYTHHTYVLHASHIRCTRVTRTCDDNYIVAFMQS